MPGKPTEAGAGTTPAELRGSVVGDLAVVSGQHMVLQLDDPDPDEGDEVGVYAPCHMSGYMAHVTRTFL